MRRALLLIAAFAAVGCNLTDDTTDVPLVITTAVEVDPQFFLGGVACSSAPGSMQSYVATLVDVTFPERPSTLPSSPPTPCSSPISFQYVGVDHVYEAFVDGYEQSVDALVPLGGASSGSRVMTTDGMQATQKDPRWTGACGTDSTSTVIAENDAVMTFQVCDPLADSGSTTATSIVVDPEGTLGAFACYDAKTMAGTITGFDVTSPGFPSYLGVPCDGATTLAYDAGVVPGTLYEFAITAHDTSDAVVAAASCSVVAEDGKQIHASCEPLTSSGAIQIDASSLPETAGLTCVTDVDPGDATNEFKGSMFPCASGALIAPLDPGPHTIKVTATDDAAKQAFMVTCSATVALGQTAVAECQ